MIWNISIICFCYTSSNCTHRIGISSQRNSQTNGIFKILTFQKSDDGFRNRTLTGNIELISDSYFITGSTKIIAKSRFNISFNLLLGFSCASQVNTCCRSLCSFNPFWVVMGNFCAFFSFFQSLL